MKYELDISGLQDTTLSHRTLAFKIPCKTGEYQMNFDVIECDVPRDIYQELIAKAKGSGDVELFPIGFDFLPVGAILRRIA